MGRLTNYAKPVSGTEHQHVAQQNLTVCDDPEVAQFG